MESTGSPLQGLPVAQTGRLIEFETAEIISLMIYPPRPVLVVSGHKPYPTMKVELVPLVYVRTPDYWGIEVVGYIRGRSRLLPAAPAKPIPYSVELDVAGVIGTVGIEVIGANRTEQIAVATEGPRVSSASSMTAGSVGGFRRGYTTGTCG